jgi:asparagine synthetase B (glutamine-hydrolysing)
MIGGLGRAADMGGITGFVGPKCLPDARVIVERMTATLVHRGPLKRDFQSP